MACGDDNMPRDAKMIKALLTSMGVNNYEPSAIRQFLELYYRNAVDLLMDAKTYSNHAGKDCVDYADVEHAIKSKSYFSFTHPPLPEVTEAALKLNKIALPRLPTLWPSLPPNEDTLIASCYQPKVQKNRYGNAVDEQEEDECVTEMQKSKLLLKLVLQKNKFAFLNQHKDALPTCCHKLAYQLHFPMAEV